MVALSARYLELPVDTTNVAPSAASFVVLTTHIDPKTAHIGPRTAHIDPFGAVRARVGPMCALGEVICAVGGLMCGVGARRHIDARLSG